MFYNITITAISVAVALIVGTVELIGVLVDQAGIDSGPLADIADIPLDYAGYGIVGLFLVATRRRPGGRRAMNPVTESIADGIGEHHALIPASAMPDEPGSEPAISPGDGASVTDWGGQAGALLQSVGSRRTPGRIAMITIMLRAGTRHLSAAELEQRLHAAGWQSDPSGIHRATGMVTERGLLHTLPAAGPVAYGLAVPLHHHAICTSCGTILEIPVDQLRTAAADTEQALRPYGFQPAPDGLAVHGRCRSCVAAPR